MLDQDGYGLDEELARGSLKQGQKDATTKYTQGETPEEK